MLTAEANTLADKQAARNGIREMGPARRRDMLEVSLPLRRLELHSSKVEARIPDGFTLRTIKLGEVDRQDTTAER